MFLSYTVADRATAQRLTDALAQSGIHTTNDVVWEPSPGQDWAARLKQNIKASDVVILLLSPAAAASSWVGAEIEVALSGDLDRRGAEVIPVLVAPMEVPTALRNRAWVDLSADFDARVRLLVEQIQATSRADFSTMGPGAFEDLIADLLKAVGFGFDDVRHRPDTDVDLRATYERTDPFGLPETEVWLVEAKLYSHQRVSVEAIRQLAGFLSGQPSGTRGLLVTNAQLTSVAQEYLTELGRKPDVRLHVLDGTQLNRLLRQFPDVTARHFGGEVEGGI